MKITERAKLNNMLCLERFGSFGWVVVAPARSFSPCPSHEHTNKTNSLHLRTYNIWSEMRLLFFYAQYSSRMFTF